MLVQTIVGTVLSVLLTLLIALVKGIGQRLEEKIGSIDAHLETLNGKFYEHVTNPALHDAEAIKVQEQIKGLLEVMRIANARIERLETKIVYTGGNT